ncbi:MAG: Na-translocating system protein MpsC family protein [Betaproteobacteria bacterium]
MGDALALSEDVEKQLASSWAKIAKERLGKGPGGITIDCCGSVLMVTLHQTLTPFERTVAQAAGGWESVRTLREQVMQVLVADFAGILLHHGYKARLMFHEVDIEADRQMVAFRIS